MRWTYRPSRDTSVPIDIQHSGGTTRINVNQQQNAAQWNVLGQYSFNAGTTYNITILAPGSADSLSTCADAVRFVETSGPPTSSEENVFIVIGYAIYNSSARTIELLESMGAQQQGNVWVYRNDERDKTYYIELIFNDMEGLKRALRTEGATILYDGHSNYGLGQVTASNQEINNQTIEDIYYIDDPRVLNMSSKWMSIPISSERETHAFPNWWPKFQDGTSGIMPFVFNDPSGIDPPYNYYLTYQIPGDPTYYKIENVHNAALERFPDCYSEPWFSADGTPPDSTNPDDIQYYITNDQPWSPSCVINGNWTESRNGDGFYNETYLITPAGQGNKEVEWIFNDLPEASNYTVLAWWPASQDMTSSAVYTINHADGNTQVDVDQSQNGGQWNELGEFYLDPVEGGSVVLTDAAASGYVAADAIRIVHPNNPLEPLQADFRVNVRFGTAPLTIDFRDQSTANVVNRSWDFGDNSPPSSEVNPEHTYTADGIYTVQLTVTDADNNSVTKTRLNYIYVGYTEPVLQAEFSANNRVGDIPKYVSFRDRSSGDILSRLWEFGDGETSTNETAPSHTYTVPGNYTVRLTVTDANNNSITETKDNFIRVTQFDKTIDNVDYPLSHFGRKTVIFRRELDIPKEELGYSRLFLLSCNSANYYLDTYHQGIVFYTVEDNDLVAKDVIPIWLGRYFAGDSDEQIWEALQNYRPYFDYYDFTKRPTEQ